MRNTIPDQNNGPPEVQEVSLECRVTLLEEQVREMARTLTILNQSQKEVKQLLQTFEWYRRRKTEAFQEKQMEP